MKNSFRSTLLTVWIVFGLCLLSFGTMHLLSSRGIDWANEYFFLVFTFPVFLFCVILLPLLYSMRSKYEAALSRFRQGEHLAHWLYEKDEWVRFNSQEWQRSRKKAVIIPAGLLAAFYVIGFLAGGLSKEDAEAIAAWAIFFAAAISLAMLAYVYLLYQRSVTCPREVVIGIDGVSFGGYYATWKIAGSRLGKVQFIAGDPSLLEFEILAWGRYGSRPAPVRVPVPRGHEAEAEDIVKKLSQGNAGGG